jgi:stress response protein YsnF
VEVPLTGEEVSMEKTVRKTGEVLVEKEAVQRQESVGGTVRREEVHVDDETVTRDAALERRRGR